MEDGHESQRSDDGEVRKPHVVGFAIAGGLLAVAFVGATTAGVLDAVGAYLLGVSVLVAALFVVVRR
jgi:hypothetical protein